MEEKDFKRIEQLVSNVVDARLGRFEGDVTGKIDAKLGQFEAKIDAKLGQVEATLDAKLGQVEAKIDAKLGQLRKDVNEDFRHHVGIISEDFKHKLQLVAVGHQMLSEKMDRTKDELNGSIQQLDKKIIAVAADIAAHRADTEGHKRGYVVSEP